MLPFPIGSVLLQPWSGTEIWQPAGELECALMTLEILAKMFTRQHPAEPLCFIGKESLLVQGGGCCDSTLQGVVYPPSARWPGQSEELPWGEQESRTPLNSTGLTLTWLQNITVLFGHRKWLHQHHSAQFPLWPSMCYPIHFVVPSFSQRGRNRNEEFHIDFQVDVLNQSACNCTLIPVVPNMTGVMTMFYYQRVSLAQQLHLLLWSLYMQRKQMKTRIRRRIS